MSVCLSVCALICVTTETIASPSFHMSLMLTFSPSSPTKQSSITLCVGIADIPADSGNVFPLDEARIHKLNFNGIHLLDCMDPNHAFVTELATAGCITWPQREFIINILQPRDRNDKLLEFIRRRSVADFENFIRVLSREQAHLVPFLVTDGGETYLILFKCSHFAH